MANLLPVSIQKAFAIDPANGSTFLDAEHIVILMQENRSFDHAFGTLQGVRGFNDPRAVRLPDGNPVWLQTNAAGDTYAPFRLDIKDTKITWMGDLPHSRASQVDAYNKGKHDHWLPAKRSGHKPYADMPLTMGHYIREDLPFNYGMADAFTICDQNFCSAMTSTTPNRSFFWTGKITHEENGLPKANIRNDDYGVADKQWLAFPELLEDNDISWKFYQNELDSVGSFTDEERAWLSNFGCNLLENFEAFNVKFSKGYIKELQRRIEVLPGEIKKLQENTPSDEAAARKIHNRIEEKQKELDNARADLGKYTPENYEKLSPKQKSLFDRAFVINNNDPHYRSITKLNYMDGGEQRSATVPKGDIFHQFREDVDNGHLPVVSWLAGPQNFSDHPSAPWYGAWYVSEVLDILTKNPDVWKKTILIYTYDENDGYYDHVPPFSIPDSKLPGSGKVSAGIETEIEHVRLENEIKQGIPEKQAREGAIGLGFRVPMIIASPWSRGGKVCSEVFDHTSTLQFLETFLNRKYGKNIHIDNISEWRRTICGDLTSVFSTFDGDKPESIPFLDLNKKVELVFNAQFKELPNNFNKLSDSQIAEISTKPMITGKQEKGVRTACAIPYELYTHGYLNVDEKCFEISFAAGNEVFGKKMAGAPFTAYVPVKYTDEASKDEVCRNWSFAVKAGDSLNYKWPLNAFENGNYHIRVHGPNGFYREFKGNTIMQHFDIACNYEKGRNGFTGNLMLEIGNNGDKAYTVNIVDNSYKTGIISKSIPAKGKIALPVNLTKSYNWYDLSIKSGDFEQRFAGHVETGVASKTDPLMGGEV